jgi:hypothetical protein
MPMKGESESSFLFGRFKLPPFTPPVGGKVGGPGKKMLK